ncbi:hypothetical protein [Chryseosolibacter indicus]|uniref:Uncharacterized protein n=1 Tax=Chryseosolibacter indicus TaxID=2782351 RepID=A0ABS5VN14_9BACT|nr:hypothetical protein [Chryseosolibacter indicus]MBT1702239.1 hypothetical protein [Chryseosolibacter indicus]
MAIITHNSLTKGARGAFGSVMFRQVRNKTIMSAKPSPPEKQSEGQRRNREKFRSATIYAKHVLLDPQKKAYYQHKARKLKLPNAYTAAITEYMRKGEIKAIAVNKKNGKVQDTVKINAYKKDFAVRKVRVVIYGENGLPVFKGEANKSDKTEFILHTGHDFLLRHNMKIHAFIDDCDMGSTPFVYTVE